MKNYSLRSGIVFATLASTAVLLATTGGCGSTGDSGTPTATTTTTTTTTTLRTARGRIIDGYVVGATVCLDVNDDRIFQPTEPCITTGADGSFAFPGLGDHMVRSTGGVDASTNTPFVGELKAPPGATVITPLTTLVVASVEATLPVPIAGTSSAIPQAATTIAETAVKANLGIPSSVALSSTDPVASAKANPNDATAAKLVQQSSAVQTLMAQTAKAVAAATGVDAPTPAQLQAIYKEATKAIATIASGGTSIDLSSTTSTFVNTVVSNTVTSSKASAEVLASLPAAAVTALAAVAPASVAAVAAATVREQVKAVSEAPAATLAASATEAAAANNPALAATKDTGLQVMISATKSLLTTAVASVNTPAVLQALSTNVVAALVTGGTNAGATVATAVNAQVTATILAIPTATVATVSATTIQSTKTAADSAVTTAIQNAGTVVATATTTTLAGTTSTAATTTTSAAPTTTTAAPTTTTAAATTTTAAPTTTTVATTTTTVATTTTTAAPTTTTAATTTTTAATTTTTAPTTTTTTTSTSSSTTTTTTSTAASGTTTTVATTTTTTTVPLLSNYFAIASNQLTFGNGQGGAGDATCSYTTFVGGGNGCVLAAAFGTGSTATSTNTISFRMVPVGTTNSSTTTYNAKLFFRIKGVSPDTRILDIGIAAVNITNTNGVLNVTVPSQTRLYIYGSGSNGSTAILSTAIGADQSVIGITSNTFTLNVASVMNSISSNVNGSFANLMSKSGTFDVTFVLGTVTGSAVPLTLADGTQLSTLTDSDATLRSSGFTAISGPGLAGRIKVP